MLATTWAALALAATPTPATPASEIMAANARWTEAVAKKDMAIVEAIVASEFKLTSGTASADETVDRANWLANLGRMQIASYKTEITDLEIHGDTAISTVSGSWDVVMGPKKVTDDFRLIDVWVRRPTGWQVVRRHITDE